MPARKANFGPTALATPANGLTLARLLGAPAIVALVLTSGPSSWLLWVLWSVLTFSDGLDGHIARRHGATRSGAFLDPLADKFLVLGALGALASTGEVGWLPVGLIAAREFAMSGFRVYAGRLGVSVPARAHAKLKTLFQDLAIGAAFLPPIGAHHRWIVTTLLWVAVALTLATGLEYGRDARALLGARTVSNAPRAAQRR